MLHIAVCDSNTEHLKTLGVMVRRYFCLRQELHARVCLFRSGEAMLTTGKQFSICILSAGTELGEGFEVARKLKEKSPHTVFVLFSESRNPAKAIEAFRLPAVQYLPAPVEEKQLYETLDSAVREEGQGEAKRIVLNSTEGLVNLRISSILYAKSSGHRVTFYLRDGKEIDSKCLRVSFSSIIEPMLENGFIRCHDSYAVNLAFVTQITAEGIQMSDGTLIPVSTKKRNWVRDMLKFCSVS